MDLLDKKIETIREEGSQANEDMSKLLTPDVCRQGQHSSTYQ